MTNKKKSSKKSRASDHENFPSWSGPLVATLVALAGSYILASWAIDSGLIFVYVLTFIALYFAAHYTKGVIGELRKK